MKTAAVKMLIAEIGLKLATTDKLGKRDKYLIEEKKIKFDTNF